MIRALLITVITVIFTGSALASDLNVVHDVLQKYRSVRSLDHELTMYTLDWAPTLKDAREKAAKEQRPIFLLVVTNSYGNIYTGHC